MINLTHMVWTMTYVLCIIAVVNSPEEGYVIIWLPCLASKYLNTLIRYRTIARSNLVYETHINGLTTLLKIKSHIIN